MEEKPRRDVEARESEQHRGSAMPGLAKYLFVAAAFFAAPHLGGGLVAGDGGGGGGRGGAGAGREPGGARMGKAQARAPGGALLGREGWARRGLHRLRAATPRPLRQARRRGVVRRSRPAITAAGMPRCWWRAPPASRSWGNGRHWPSPRARRWDKRQDTSRA